MSAHQAETGYHQHSSCFTIKFSIDLCPGRCKNYELHGIERYRKARLLEIGHTDCNKFSLCIPLTIIFITS